MSSTEASGSTVTWYRDLKKWCVKDNGLRAKLESAAMEYGSYDQYREDVTTAALLLRVHREKYKPWNKS